MAAGIIAGAVGGGAIAVSDIGNTDDDAPISTIGHERDASDSVEADDAADEVESDAADEVDDTDDEGGGAVVTTHTGGRSQTGTAAGSDTSEPPEATSDDSDDSDDEVQATVEPTDPSSDGHYPNRDYGIDEN